MFSCKRGCTRDDYGKAGPFSVEWLKIDLPFVNVLCVQTSAQRSAGPLSARSWKNAMSLCGTEEILHPCLIYLRVISLVARERTVLEERNVRVREGLIGLEKL